MKTIRNVNITTKLDGRLTIKSDFKQKFKLYLLLLEVSEIF